MTGGAHLPRRVYKELKVSVPTVCGLLSTIGIGLVVRRVLPTARLASMAAQAFVGFTVYGLALSLVVSAATVIRRRDTIILILAATIVWGIFVEDETTPGMIRYLTFCTLMTLGVLWARRLASGSLAGARVVLGALLPAVLCALGGLGFHRIAQQRFPNMIQGGSAVGGLTWGLWLGLAVGLGVAIGGELVGWIVKKAA
jgi:hypothetical protein